MKIDDVITKLNLRQSAFCIDIFDADIQIPETSLQALSPFPPSFPPPPPRELARTLQEGIHLHAKYDFPQEVAIQHPFFRCIVKSTRLIPKNVKNLLRT